MASEVRGVAEWLGQQLVEEAKLLYGVKGKVEKLQRQLEWMESCYKDAQALDYTNSSILSLWVDEVNQLANESRDVIQKYLDEVASSKTSPQSGCFVKVVKTPLHMICTIKPRHEVNSGIDSLMQKMEILGSNLHVFGFGLKVGNGGVYDKKSYAEETILIEGANVIGLEKYVAEVVDELLDKGGENTVVVLYGPRGVGKTALAKMACQNKDIKKGFNGLISWIRVSRGFKLRDVLERILNDLNEVQSAMSTETQLVNELRKILQQRRCLVVLDDLWSKDLLDYLRPAFSTRMHSGSKVMLTTSLDLKELAQFPNAKAFESPKTLNSEESWKLLEMTLGRHVSTDPEKMSIGGEMLKKCKGLPSNIVMLGKILKDKATPEEWLTAYLSVDDPLRTTSNVLQSSYNKVPNHLKPCLLHLGNFPEEYEISAARLFRMWIAEGFVPSSNWASGSEKSMEDIARDYLNELAEQYFVAVTNRGSNLRIKTCLLHDLVRDFCLRKAEEEGFLSIIDRHVDPEDSSSILDRMTIHLDDNFDSVLLASNLPHKYSAYLKSLVIFPMYDEHMESNYDQQWLEYACGECTRLKVLDIEGLGIYGSFPGRIDNMVFLRYLSLKGTRITNVPSSIGNLRYLQTLDLRVSYLFGEVVTIPNTISEITMLIFLFLPAISYEIEGTQVLRLHTLSNLETFKNLDATKCEIHDLLGLTKMRRLSLKTCEKDTLKDLLESPVTASRHLQRLSVAVEGNVISQESSILSSCECLYRVNVEGRIAIPLRHNIFPPYLEVLMLESSNLENDPMPILGYLPNLRRLCLGKDSFLGDMMTCCADGFVQLRELTLRCLPNIEKWILEVGALHVLKQLLIDKCDKLLTLPDHFPASVLVTQKSNRGEIQEYIS